MFSRSLSLGFLAFLGVLVLDSLQGGYPSAALGVAATLSVIPAVATMAVEGIGGRIWSWPGTALCFGLMFVLTLLLVGSLASRFQS